MSKAVLWFVGLVVAASCVACGTAPSRTNSDGTRLDDPVGVPSVNWDSPVIDGVDLPISGDELAQPEAAMARAQVAFAPIIPHSPDAHLVRVQAPDPVKYPAEGRGYGVLMRFSSLRGDPRVLIEETAVAPSDTDVVKGLASNGAGYELITIRGVDVAFIHPDDNMASALFVLGGVKYNVQGPAIPFTAIRPIVELVINGARVS